MAPSIEDLSRISREIRGKLVEMSHQAGMPHLGSALSVVDILVAAYWNVARIDPHKPEDENRDRFILSKGHAASALYTVLAKRGFFSTDVLASFGQEGSCLAEQ